MVMPICCAADAANRRVPHTKPAASSFFFSCLFGDAFILVLFNQVVIQDLPSQRCRRCRSEAAVFDHNRKRNFGLINRRKSNKQRMIAVTFFNFIFVVSFALFDAENLRGSRLAADRIRSAGKNRSAGSLLRHILHGAFNKVDVFFFQRNNVDGIFRHNLFFAGL